MEPTPIRRRQTRPFTGWHTVRIEHGRVFTLVIWSAERAECWDQPVNPRTGRAYHVRRHHHVFEGPEANVRARRARDAARRRLRRRVKRLAALVQ